MKISILGTGTSQGIPVLGCGCAVCRSADPRDQRLRVAVLIEGAAANVLVDIGPDFRQQLLRCGSPRIDAVLLTHEHNDHIAGLDDIRPYNFKYGRDMPVYGLPRVLAAVAARFAYIFAEKPYPGVPQVRLQPLEAGGVLELGDLRIEALGAWHGRLPVLGFRVGGFAYLTDVNGFPAETLERLHGLDCLVLDALHHEAHHAHFTLAEAIEWAGRIGARRTYFTHMSHQMGRHAEVAASLPPGLHLAYDGLVIEG